MLNEWERHHETIAKASVSHDRTVSTTKTSALAGRNVVCSKCSGTGLAARVSMRRDEWAVLCEDCHGRGYLTMVKPKQVAEDFGLSTKQKGIGVSHKPKIVCLCGSTRFYEAFQKANYEETMAGRIVLSVGFYPHAVKILHGSDIGCTPEQKVSLDELHKRKIDLADEVFVLNVGGYIGDSTRSEIEYAVKHGKPVRYLEVEK